MLRLAVTIIIAGAASLPWYEYCWERQDMCRTVDFNVMMCDCFAGPGKLVPFGCAQRYDRDSDGDVDLADVAIWDRHRDRDEICEE